jgi:hypothetical protein
MKRDGKIFFKIIFLLLLPFSLTAMQEQANKQIIEALKKDSNESAQNYIDRLNVVCSFLFLQDEFYKKLATFTNFLDYTDQNNKNFFKDINDSLEVSTNQLENGNTLIKFPDFSGAATTSEQIVDYMRLSPTERAALCKLFSKSDKDLSLEFNDNPNSTNEFVKRIYSLIRQRIKHTEISAKFTSLKETLYSCHYPILFFAYKNSIFASPCHEHFLSNKNSLFSTDTIKKTYVFSFYKLTQACFNNWMFKSSPTEDDKTIFSSTAWYDKTKFLKPCAEKYKTVRASFAQLYDSVYSMLVKITSNVKKNRHLNYFIMTKKYRENALLESKIPTFKRFLSEKDTQERGYLMQHLEILNACTKPEDPSLNFALQNSKQKALEYFLITKYLDFLRTYTLLPKKFSQDWPTKIQIEPKKVEQKKDLKKIFDAVKMAQSEMDKPKNDQSIDKIIKSSSTEEVLVLSETPSPEEKTNKTKILNTKHYLQFYCPIEKRIVKFYKVTKNPITEFKLGKRHQRITNWFSDVTAKLMQSKYDASKFTFSLYKNGIFHKNVSDLKEKQNLIKIHHTIAYDEFVKNMLSLGTKTIWNKNEHGQPMISIPGEITDEDGDTEYGVFSMTLSEDGPYHYCFTDMIKDAFLIQKLEEGIKNVYEEIDNLN